MKITEHEVAMAVRYANGRPFIGVNQQHRDIAAHLNQQLAKRRRRTLRHFAAEGAFILGAIVALGGVIGALGGIGAGYFVAVAGFILAVFSDAMKPKSDGGHE